MILAPLERHVNTRWPLKLMTLPEGTKDQTTKRLCKYAEPFQFYFFFLDFGCFHFPAGLLKKSLAGLLAGSNSLTKLKYSLAFAKSFSLEKAK